jgi:hypothetical protein
LMPLTASGSVASATRQWQPRLIVSLAVLVAYKPMAAVIYQIAATLTESGDDVTTIVTGLVTLLLAAVALPVMLKFFSTWTGTRIGGAEGSGMLSAAGSVGASVASRPSGAPDRSQAVVQTRAMETTGPNSAAPAGADTPPPPEPMPAALSPSASPPAETATPISGVTPTAPTSATAPASAASGGQAALTSASSAAPASTASTASTAASGAASGAGVPGAVLQAGQGAYQSVQAAAEQTVPPGASDE